jgi:6,7-dimethyl-8-ribityllumazine synthase
MQLSINSKKPIGNGIITTLNKKQAESRSLTKGKEAAAAVLSVLDNF